MDGQRTVRQPENSSRHDLTQDLVEDIASLLLVWYPARRAGVRRLSSQGAVTRRAPVFFRLLRPQCRGWHR